MYRDSHGEGVMLELSWGIPGWVAAGSPGLGAEQVVRAEGILPR